MGCFVRGVKKWHGMFCPGMFCPAPILVLSFFLAFFLYVLVTGSSNCGFIPDNLTLLMFICLFTVGAKFCKDYVIATERMDVTIHFVHGFKCMYNMPWEGWELERG